MLQRCINARLLSLEEISPYATAYKPGGSTKMNARLHIGKPVLLKLDIKRFFDNLSYKHLTEKVFTQERYSEQISALLSILCLYMGALPQGAPTSPTISNIIMCDFDEKVGAFCNNKGIAYTRYCDDMTFSGDFDEGEVIALVKSELKKLGLFLKNRKTTVVSKAKRQAVTGVVVNEKINLTKEYKKKIRQEMYYIQKFGIDGHLKRLGVSDKTKHLNSLKGRIAFVLQIVPNDKEFLGYKELVRNKL
jgi:retron-type reverse transcriptase